SRAAGSEITGPIYQGHALLLCALDRNEPHLTPAALRRSLHQQNARRFNEINLSNQYGLTHC
ncbi:hypothetical protein, partial [Mesorhizobium sp. P5_C1]